MGNLFPADVFTAIVAKINLNMTDKFKGDSLCDQLENWGLSQV